MFIRRIECGVTDIDKCCIGKAYKAAVTLGVSLDEFYIAAKNTKPSHKVGSPFMVKGQPAKVRGDSWKYRRKGSEALKPAQNILEEKKSSKNG